MTITERPLPPLFYGLRLWWNELVRRDHQAATLRWQMNNATKPQECLCGAPGTVAEEAAGFRGDAAPIFWSCDEHVDVPLNAWWIGGVPQINQTREECSWHGAKIGGPIHECGCGTHVGEMPDEREWFE